MSHSPSSWSSGTTPGVSTQNRLWFVDLELRGSGTALVLDCGADGETRVSGPFFGGFDGLAGEARHLVLPVPVRAPLGVDGLSALPLPRVYLEGAGSARVLGWAAQQPGAELERACPWLERVRPPLVATAPRVGSPEVLLVLLTGAFLLALRRVRIRVGLALCSGVLALALARGRSAALPSSSVLEVESGAGQAVLVNAALGELWTDGVWLEVRPEDARLVLSLAGDELATFRAQASGKPLYSLAASAAPELVPGRNGWEDLDAVWTRSAAGVWRFRGTWKRGVPLPAAEEEPVEAPPGWLASAMPPGQSVLLGRRATTPGASKVDWLRLLGFPLGD